MDVLRDTPTTGMTVTAWIGNKLCGSTHTLMGKLHGRSQVVYDINVIAENPNTPNGCGLAGKLITFRINNKVISPAVVWDTTQVWEVTLGGAAPPGSEPAVYLPVIFSK